MNIYSILNKFGFDNDQSAIFVYIYTNGANSVLNISRALKIQRTKVYRLLEELVEKGFILEELHETGKRFVACDIDKFKMLILQKENELDELKNTAPILYQQLSLLTFSKSPDSKILYYKGKDALKQITWNSTKANQYLKIYEISSSMNTFIDFEFSEKIRREFMKNNIKTKQLTNIKYFEPWTSITDYPLFCETRFIDKTILDIQFEILIYNDVYVMYSFENQNVYCVEIYDKKLTQMQNQIFDIIWKQSKPLQIIGKGGEMKLI